MILYSRCTILEIDCTVFSDTGLSVIPQNRFYSDGTYCYGVTDGVIVSKALCGTVVEPTATFIKTGTDNTVQSQAVHGTLSIPPNTTFGWSVNLNGVFNPFTISDGHNTYPVINSVGLHSGTANSGATGVLAMTFTLTVPLGSGNNGYADVQIFNVADNVPYPPDGFILMEVEQP